EHSRRNADDVGKRGDRVATATAVVAPVQTKQRSATRRGKHKHRGQPGARSVFPYALVVPILAFELVFVIYPIIKGVDLAFYNTNFGVTSFVGWSNFSQMIHDPLFWSSIQTTFEFTFAMVGVWLS